MAASLTEKYAVARPVRSVPWEREVESALGGRGGPGSSEGPEGGPASRAGRPRAAFQAGPLRTQPEPGKQLRGWLRAPRAPASLLPSARALRPGARPRVLPFPTPAGSPGRDGSALGPPPGRGGTPGGREARPAEGVGLPASGRRRSRSSLSRGRRAGGWGGRRRGVESRWRPRWRSSSGGGGGDWSERPARRADQGPGRVARGAASCPSGSGPRRPPRFVRSR